MRCVSLSLLLSLPLCLPLSLSLYLFSRLSNSHTLTTLPPHPPQVHRSQLEFFTGMLKQVMEQQVPRIFGFPVNLAVNIEVGSDWGNAEAYLPPPQSQQSQQAARSRRSAD